MVDALQAAHRRVRRGGLVIDARPDASRHPRIVARGRVRGYLRQRPDADQLDRHANAAVDRVVAYGLYRRLRRGLIWYGARFTDLAELERYLENTTRYREQKHEWRSALLPYRRGPLTMRCAVKFEVLARLALVSTRPTVAA